MNIKNVKIYGLDESIIRSGYPMQVGEPGDIEYDCEGALTYYDNDEGYDFNKQDLDKKRANKLAKVPLGSGHDNYLKGIIVQFDLQYPEYFSPQLQRYHWIDIVSSQSKMHKLVHVKDIKEQYNEYVLSPIIQLINKLIEIYNNNEFPIQYKDRINCLYFNIKDKQECFNYIISNLPSGYLKWMGISTNYLQLKTIYNQRKNHKLEEWRYFCKWIETLPYSKELITIEK